MRNYVRDDRAHVKGHGHFVARRTLRKRTAAAQRTRNSRATVLATSAFPARDYVSLSGNRVSGGHTIRINELNKMQKKYSEPRSGIRGHSRVVDYLPHPETRSGIRGHARLKR